MVIAGTRSFDLNILEHSVDQLTESLRAILFDVAPQPRFTFCPTYSVFLFIRRCVFQRIAELVHEVAHLSGVLTSLFLPLDFSQIGGHFA